MMMDLCCSNPSGFGYNGGLKPGAGRSILDLKMNHDGSDKLEPLRVWWRADDDDKIHDGQGEMKQRRVIGDSRNGGVEDRLLGMTCLLLLRTTGHNDEDSTTNGRKKIGANSLLAPKKVRVPYRPLKNFKFLISPRSYFSFLIHPLPSNWCWPRE
jgi:hypothetical protein